MRLEPLYFYRYSNAGDLDVLRRLHLMDCSECGCCAYACPGKVPLMLYLAGRCLGGLQ